MNNEDIVSLMERYKRELLEFEKRNTAPVSAQEKAEPEPVSAQQESQAEQVSAQVQEDAEPVNAPAAEPAKAVSAKAEENEAVSAAATSLCDGLAEKTVIADYSDTENKNGKKFKGRIWILTDGANASSSEQLVQFAKGNEACTVVGTQTQGMSGTMAPLYNTDAAMPNCGMLVRFNAFYFLNEDGTWAKNRRDGKNCGFWLQLGTACGILEMVNMDQGGGDDEFNHIFRQAQTAGRCEHHYAE